MRQQWWIDGQSEVGISTSACQRENKIESEQRLRKRVIEGDMKGERASEWLSEWDEKHRSSSSRHQHLYHHHHQSSSSIGIAYLSWDSNDESMDSQKSGFLKVLERERDRAKNKKASEWSSEWDRDTAREWLSEIKNIDHHHHVISISIIIIIIIRVAAVSELLTCHGTVMIIRWTVGSRDF